MQSNNSLILLAILIAIVVTALAINYYFHQQEQQRLLRLQRSRALKKEIQKTIDALTALKPVNPPAGILERLSEHAASLISQLAQLNPEAGVVDQLRSRSASDSPEPAKTGLHGVQAIQNATRVASSVLRTQQQQGRITPLQVTEFNKELAWLHIASEADAFINEGRRLLETGKTALALSHFKHAKGVVAKCSSKEPRRAQRLDEIRVLLEEANPFKSTPKDDQAKLE